MTTGTERIENRILEQANIQADTILQKAQDDATKVIEQAKKEAEKQAIIVRKQAQEKIAEDERRSTSVADLESRKLTLSAKRVVLEKAYEEAYAAFLRLDDATYIQLYQTMVLQSIESGNEEIIPASFDRDRLGQDFVNTINQALKEQNRLGNITLLPPNEQMRGGVIVKDGRMEINLSTETVLQRAREKTESDVARMLFAPSGTEEK